MGVESADDRAAYLADFGQTMVSGAYSLTVIFNAPYYEAGDMAGFKPAAIGRTADVDGASISRGSTVTIGGVDYKVRDIQDDGEGFTVLVFEES